jgi:hypothetical protein
LNSNNYLICSYDNDIIIIIFDENQKNIHSKILRENIEDPSKIKILSIIKKLKLINKR